MTPDRITALIEWNEQRAKLAQYDEDAQAHRETAAALWLLLPPAAVAVAPEAPPPAAALPPTKPSARARKRAH